MEPKDNGRVSRFDNPLGWPVDGSEGHEHDYGGSHKPTMVMKIVEKIRQLKRRKERRRRHRRGH